MSTDKTVRTQPAWDGGEGDERTPCACGHRGGDISFDRSICACGSMHYYCNGCGYPVDCDRTNQSAPDPRETV